MAKLKPARQGKRSVANFDPSSGEAIGDGIVTPVGARSPSRRPSIFGPLGVASAALLRTGTESAIVNGVSGH